jgi:phage shock protein C
MSNDKKLTRSTENRWLAGVCGGLGEYLNIDPTIIRVLFVLITLLFSMVLGGVIVYAILWIVMPESESDVPSAKILSEDE